MKIKSCLVVMVCLVLVGCGSTSQPKEEPEISQKTSLFEGLDAEETYLAAVKYFNENVTYYQSEVTEEMSESYLEYYQLDDEVAIATKSLYDYGDISFLNYYIISGNSFHSLYLGDNGEYQYEKIEDYAEVIDQMYQDVYQMDGYEVIDIERKDEDNGIILNLKVRYDAQDEMSDNTSYINEMKINADGLICEEKMICYFDDQFNEVISEVTMVYSDFNAKNQNDLEDEIQLMLSCQGMSDDELKNVLGFHI